VDVEVNSLYAKRIVIEDLVGYIYIVRVDSLVRNLVPFIFQKKRDCSFGARNNIFVVRLISFAELLVR
jgi:hypothetical protein